MPAQIAGFTICASVDAILSQQITVLRTVQSKIARRQLPGCFCDGTARSFTAETGIFVKQAAQQEYCLGIARGQDVEDLLARIEVRRCRSGRRSFIAVGIVENGVRQLIRHRLGITVAGRLGIVGFEIF